MGRNLIKKERNVLTTDYFTTDYFTTDYLFWSDKELRS